MVIIMYTDLKDWQMEMDSIRNDMESSNRGFNEKRSQLRAESDRLSKEFSSNDDGFFTMCRELGL